MKIVCKQGAAQSSVNHIKPALFALGAAPEQIPHWKVVFTLSLMVNPAA